MEGITKVISTRMKKVDKGNRFMKPVEIFTTVLGKMIGEMEKANIFTVMATSLLAYG